MEKKTTHTLLAIAVLVLALDLGWRYYRHRKLGEVKSIPEQQDETEPFAAPLMQGTAGIAAATNPAQPFQSAINVNVNPDIAQYLSHHYIPLFGFVGFGAGSPPTGAT